MKRILSITLTLLLTLNTLPLNAQENVQPVILREDIEDYDEIHAITSKELNQIAIDNPVAVHQEFIEILKWKSTQAFKDLKKNPGKTYSDKQTAWNMALFPIIDKGEKYPKSKYFQDPYQLYHYALEVYWQNITTPEAQQIGLKDYRNRANQHIKQLITKRSQDKDFFTDTTIDESVNPMNEAAYLVAYATQINSFYNEVREAKLAQQKCKNLNEAEFWGYSQEECVLINTLAKDYDLKIIDMGRQRIGTFASIAADAVDQCLRNVLMPLQTPLLPFEEVDEFLNSMGGSESAWASCGMTKTELIQIITDNSMTREEAKKSLKKGLGGKILQGLDYASFSYWVEKGDKTKEFEDYVIDNFGEEKLEQLKEEGKEKQEMEIANRMAESYNAVLSAIATDLIAYGKIYYYNNDVNLVGLNEDNVPVNASAKFATTWYKIGTDPTQENSPIAKFARGAILQAGGKAKNLQNGLFTKTMYEVKAKENVKTNVMILSMAMDFAADPLMVLAPLQMSKGTKFLKIGAKYAPKTTAKVTKAAETVGKGVQTAKNAVVDSKVGRGLQEVTKPVKQLKSKAGDFVRGSLDDWSDMGKHLDDAKTAPKTTKDLTKGAETTTDIAEDFTKAPATPKPEPVTATNPEQLGPKLTGEFDDLVASAKPEETMRGIGFKPQPKSTTSNPKGCIGFNCSQTSSVAPTNTTTGVPEGMQRQIGFGKSDTYIPDNAGKAVSGKGGVQDFTQGTKGPQGRGTEGPTASRNPYDVRNSAGNPDTPGTPQQDLSGLNKQIKNEPSKSLTKSEADDIISKRHKAIDDSYTGTGAYSWKEMDRTYHGTVKVEPYGKGKYHDVTVTQANGEKTILGKGSSFMEGDNLLKITKADGNVETVRADQFRSWLDGIRDCPECKISERERQAMQGYDDVMSKLSDYEANALYTDRTRKLPNKYSYNTPYKIKSWEEQDKLLHGAVEVKFRENGTGITVIKANGKKVDGISANSFREWVDGNVPGCPECKISEREKQAIKGYDDFISMHDNMKLEYERVKKIEDFIATGKNRGENAWLFHEVDIDSRGMVKSWNNGCYNIKSCNNLIDHFISSRELVKNDMSTLQQLFAKATGNNDVETFYKALLDSNNTPNNIRQFLSDKKLRDFILNNGNIPDVTKITDNMLPYLNWQDLVKVLKSNTPDSLKLLRQVTSNDDWKVVVSKSKELLGKRRAYFVEQYTDALNDIEKIAPKAVEDIRKGKVPHSVTLTKAGVDKQQAQNIAYWYNGIKQIDAIL